MNIFYTDTSPHLCAVWLDDKRLNKMIIECNQMLSAALVSTGVADLRELCNYPKSVPNHPCTKWVASNWHHALWLMSWQGAMLEAWQKNHGGSLFRSAALTYVYQIPNSTDVCEPPKCNPYKDDTSTVIESYRKTMIVKWSEGSPKWTRGNFKPEWYNANVD